MHTQNWVLIYTINSIVRLNQLKNIYMHRQYNHSPYIYRQAICRVSTVYLLYAF